MVQPDSYVFSVKSKINHMQL